MSPPVNTPSNPKNEPAAHRAAAWWRLGRPSSDFYVWLDQQRATRPLLLALVTLAVGLLLTPNLGFNSNLGSNASEGTIASDNVKAPYDLNIIDTEASQRWRNSVAEQTQRVYDFDTQLVGRTEARLHEAFAFMRDFVDDTHRSTQKRQLEKLLSLSLSDQEYSVLKAARFDTQMEAILMRYLSTGQSAPLVAQAAALEDDKERGILLQRLPNNGQVPQAFTNVGALLDVNQARLLLAGQTVHLFPGLSETQRTALVSLAARLLEPNVALNQLETQRRREQARAAAKPVSLAIKKGEMIVRDGERINTRHLLILETIRHKGRGASIILVGVGGVVLLWVLIGSTKTLLGGYSRQRRQLQARDVLCLACIFTSSLLGARLGLMVTKALHENYPQMPLDVLILMLPLAAGTLLVRLVLRLEVAVLFALLSSLILGLLGDSERFLSLYVLVGSLTAAGSIRSIAARSDLLRAGVWVGVAQSACALGIFLLTANTQWQLYVLALPSACLGGILSGFVALSVTPLLEWAFNYTTDLKLLELSNLNHPALKELIVQAPGSYHHSIIVGALVEAAAESIGANPLLARVMAYYHDLGKGCNPMYFVENQRAHHNPHDKLKPSMSAMIIRRHVTDGLELAKKYALGEAIVAGIAQHHGTTLIHYFYHKAKELADSEVQTHETVSEAEYRYPGQKPQSREAALVMVGDSIEAAARAMPEPTTARLQGLVNRIINAKFSDGQLEECDLTLRDLHTIAKAFSRVLNSIYHHRVEYPEASRDTASKKPATDAEHKATKRPETPEPAKPPPPADHLHRLGL